MANKKPTNHNKNNKKKSKKYEIEEQERQLFMSDAERFKQRMIEKGKLQDRKQSKKNKKNKKGWD